MPLKAKGEGELDKEIFTPQCRFNSCENKEGRTEDRAGTTPDGNVALRCQPVQYGAPERIPPSGFPSASTSLRHWLA